MMTDKISIRFFGDREVRAIGDYYQKICNYWKYFKAKLKKENNQVVSKATQLKNLCIGG